MQENTRERDGTERNRTRRGIQRRELAGENLATRRRLASPARPPAKSLEAALLLAFALLLGALLFAGLFAFLLRRVLGERHGHGGESHREAEHQRHQFLHCVSPSDIRRFPSSGCRIANGG